MTDESLFVRPFHDCYVLLTGLAVPLTLLRIWKWGVFRKDFTESDLRLVIRHIQRNQDRVWACRMLRFSALIEDVDRFSEHLAEALAMQRQKQGAMDPERAKALSATGRDTSKPQPEPKRVGDILAGLAAFKEFQAMKENL